MTLLDDDIRDLLRDALHDEPTPLTASEVAHRSVDIPCRTVTGRTTTRRVRLVVAGIALVASVFAAILVLNHNRSNPSHLASGRVPTVDRYFLPTVLPQGWVLLDAAETAQPGTETARTILIEREDPPALLQVSANHLANPDDYHKGYDGSFKLSDGTGSFGSISTPTRSGIGFDFTHGSTLFDASGWGITDPAAVAEQISTDTDGVPTIDRASGFAVVASSPSIPVQLDASYSLIYGIPGRTDTFAFVGVEQSSELVDPRLRMGPFAERTSVDGRDAWVDDGETTLIWMADAVTRVIVSTIPPNANAVDVFAGIQEVGRSDFDAAVRTIAKGRTSTASWDLELAGRTVRLDQIGDGDRFWLCLSEHGLDRRCTLATPAQRVQDNTIDTSVSIMTNTHWYIVRAPSAGDVEPAVDRTKTVDEQWEISAINESSDTATVQTSEFSRTWYRPAI